MLVIPLYKMKMEFNPTTLQPLGTYGTVYPTIRVVDVCGILKVSQGALMSPSFDHIQGSAPENLALQPIHGDGWMLELNPGWSIVKGERKGDFIVKKTRP